jgi:hypothetical protein
MSVPYLWSVEWETVALAIVGCPNSGVEEWGKEGQQRQEIVADKALLVVM